MGLCEEFLGGQYIPVWLQPLLSDVRDFGLPGLGKWTAGLWNSVRLRHVKGKAAAAFFQDDWRITPKLILNLGLRYEYTTPITEADNRFANFDPARGLLQLGKNTDRMWNADKNNFAPRVGFAWDVAGN